MDADRYHDSNTVRLAIYDCVFLAWKLTLPTDLFSKSPSTAGT